MKDYLAWFERNQVIFYLAAIVLGGFLGWAVPAASGLRFVIEPILALLLFVTFLGVPFSKTFEAFRDLKFLAALLLLNFLLVPAVVYLLANFVADKFLLLAVLLVLLTPCVDYVIVFAGLAGGSVPKLLAAAPLLMLLQLLLLPLYLYIFIGAESSEIIKLEPFLSALVFLVLLPLLAAITVQLLSNRFKPVRGFETAAKTSMVPLMCLTLLVVVASQFGGVAQKLAQLLGLVPIFVGFAATLLLLGILIGRLFRLPVPEKRALVFSGVTRNSLVVLPLALAVSAENSLLSYAVVTQTLVELIVMVILVQLVPKLIPDNPAQLAVSS